MTVREKKKLTIFERIKKKLFRKEYVEVVITEDELKPAFYDIDRLYRLEADIQKELNDYKKEGKG